WQVFIHGTQAVTNPGAQGRMFQFTRMTTRLPGKLCAVIVVNGVKRANHGEIVSTLADMLKPVADDQSALTVFLEARLERHDNFAIAMRGVCANDVGINALRFEDILVMRLLD